MVSGHETRVRGVIQLKAVRQVEQGDVLLQSGQEEEKREKNHETKEASSGRTQSMGVKVWSSLVSWLPFSLPP